MSIFRGREVARAIPALLELAEHRHAEVRFGVVHGLMRHSQPDAIRALIRLSQDSDRDVRNWATFGIGSQIEDDTPEIREALRANLADPNHEVRGEAMVGLAKRNDPCITDILIREWQSNDSVCVLSVDAAGIAADARLLEHLTRFRADIPPHDDSSFKSALESAIRACGGELESRRSDP